MAFLLTSLEELGGRNPAGYIVSVMPPSSSVCSGRCRGKVKGGQWSWRAGVGEGDVWGIQPRGRVGLGKHSNYCLTLLAGNNSTDLVTNHCNYHNNWYHCC